MFGEKDGRTMYVFSENMTLYNFQQLAVLIRDVYPGSRILIFTHPGSRIQKQQ